MLLLPISGHILGPTRARFGVPMLILPPSGHILGYPPHIRIHFWGPSGALPHTRAHFGVPSPLLPHIRACFGVSMLLLSPSVYILGSPPHIRIHFGPPSAALPPISAHFAAPLDTSPFIRAPFVLRLSPVRLTSPPLTPPPPYFPSLQVQIRLHQRACPAQDPTGGVGEGHPQQCPHPERVGARVRKDAGGPRGVAGHLPHRGQQGDNSRRPLGGCCGWVGGVDGLGVCFGVGGGALGEAVGALRLLVGCSCSSRCLLRCSERPVGV